MLNYLWVEKRGFPRTQMDQEKCIFVYTHIHIKGGEGDGEILRTGSLNLESVGGYDVCYFLGDMKNITIKCQGK